MPTITSPYDVATLIKPNQSVSIVLLFRNGNDAGRFFHAFFKNKDFDLDIIKQDDGKYSFQIESSNSPSTVVVNTQRTEKNNETIKKLTDPDYRDYVYLTCGYKNEQSNEVLTLNEEVPAFPPHQV
jgi:hypothetical protein